MKYVVNYWVILHDFRRINPCFADDKESPPYELHYVQVCTRFTRMLTHRFSNTSQFIHRILFSEWNEWYSSYYSLMRSLCLESLFSFHTCTSVVISCNVRWTSIFYVHLIHVCPSGHLQGVSKQGASIAIFKKYIGMFTHYNWQTFPKKPHEGAKACLLIRTLDPRLSARGGQKHKNKNDIGTGDCQH